MAFFREYMDDSIKGKVKLKSEGETYSADEIKQLIDQLKRLKIMESELSIVDLNKDDQVLVSNNEVKSLGPNSDLNAINGTIKRKLFFYFGYLLEK